MQKIVIVLLILSFVLPVPVYAGSEAPQGALDLKYIPPDRDSSFNKAKFAALDSSDFIPVERKLIDEQKALKQGESGSGSSLWKWALGILIVGGLAAAAGGGGGGGGSSAPSGGSTPPPTTGTVHTTW